MFGRIRDTSAQVVINHSPGKACEWDSKALHGKI